MYQNKLYNCYTHRYKCIIIRYDQTNEIIKITIE